MSPQAVFCPNPACSSRGKAGAANIGIKSQKERRYFCKTCKKSFAETQGTPLFGLKQSHSLFFLVVTLLSYGCPPQAIVAAFGLDERTVFAWQQKAGRHCEQVHQALVEQPRDLVQVQADEIRVKLAKKVVIWMAMAIQVPTRLWLGGVLSTRRDQSLIDRLAQKVRACALTKPLLLAPAVCCSAWFGVRSPRLTRLLLFRGRLGDPCQHLVQLGPRKPPSVGHHPGDLSHVANGDERVRVK